MPPALAKRPRLSRYNEIYSEAFYTLSSGRQNTDHVINPILFSDVLKYCDCIGVTNGFERLYYWKMVNACDIAFVEAMLEKRKSDTALAAAAARLKPK